MKRYSQHQIEALLDKFMDGQTTVEEEALLADYFRTHDVPAEWEDYRDMFGYFDRGMEGELVPEQEPQPSLAKQMGRRWWGIAAAACITAAVVGTVALQHRPSSQTAPEITEVLTQDTEEQSQSPEETQDSEHLQTSAPSAQTVTTRPVEKQHFASHSQRSKVVSRKTARRLKAENKRLIEENERLQRELADLKRRAFIIDLEANGFRAVKNEDGNIVLIDLEQEIENEFNNQPTTNIPEL